VALYPPEGAVAFDHPYVELARNGDEGQIQQAAAFRDFLLGAQAQDLLRERGYRGADDTPGDVLETDDNLDPDRSGADSAPPDGRAVAAVQEGWEALSRRFTTLAVMDVSGSMAEPVPGTGRSLMQFVVESAGRGAALFADDSNLGLWEFSTELPGGEQGGDYRELVQIGPVGEDLGGITRRDALRRALTQMQPTNDTSLYDTVLAAYIRARDATVPGRPTAVALFTDGRSDGDDLSLEGLLDRLRQEQDPARPVRMALIAYGENPPTAELTQVADLIGGRVFTPSSPEGITQVFLDVLTSP
jgi:Ca-activated chloride channel homolog